jgi:hypothetical protein
VTWLKLSDDFEEDCVRADLSDAAFRCHVDGLLWAMRRENGGFLDSLAIRKGIETQSREAAIAELLAAGFWRRAQGGFQVVHGMDDQPEPDVIAARRKADRERQARRRDKAARPGSHGVTHAVTHEGVTRDPGRDGSGRELLTSKPALDKKGLAPEEDPFPHLLAVSDPEDPWSSAVGE